MMKRLSNLIPRYQTLSFPHLFQNKIKFHFSIKQYTDLDIQAITEEIKYLNTTNNIPKSTQKISHLLKYYLSQENKNYTMIFDCIKMLSQNLLHLDRKEESIETMESFLKLIEGKEGDEFVFMALNIRDQLANQYSTVETDDATKSKSLLMKNIQVLIERVKQDKVSLIEDKCLLATNMWNYTNILLADDNESDENTEEVNETYSNLLKIYEIFNEYPDRLQSMGFGLLNNLAVFSLLVGKEDDAINYYHKSLKLKKAVGEEDNDECFQVHVELGKIYLDSEHPSHDKAAKHFESAADIKHRTIKLLHNKDVDGRQHFIEFGRLYELMAEHYFDVKDKPNALKYSHLSLDMYFQFKLEPIYMARIYFLLAELYYDDNDKGTESVHKTIEYAQRYLEAFNKFLFDHRKEIDSKSTEIERYTRISWDVLKIFVYKSYKYVAESYNVLKDAHNTNKYCDLGIDTINRLNDEDEKDDRVEGAEDSDEMLRFLTLRYEVAKLNELRKNYNVALMQYRNVIERMNSTDKTKFSGESDVKINFNRDVVIRDCLMSQSNIYIELELFENAKECLLKLSDMLSDAKTGKDDKFVDDLNKKMHIVNFKLKTKKQN